MKPIYCILKLQSLWGLDISGRCCFELGCGHEYGFLVGGLEHFSFFHRLGMSSSQLTNSIIFQRGSYTNHQPDSMFNLGVLVIRSDVVFITWQMGTQTNQLGMGWGNRKSNLDVMLMHPQLLQIQLLIY